jgi:amino acid transporter
MRVDLNGKVLAVMLTAEIIVAIVFDVVMVGNPSSEGVTFATLSPNHLVSAGIGAGLVLAITGFVGFEATVVFSEETKDPQRTIARATYIAVGLTGVLYGLSAWAMSVATGPDKIVESATADGTDLIFNLVLPHVGQTMVTIGYALFITSIFAALLSFHNTVARYGFALGREGVLPSWMGIASRRTGAPSSGSIAQTVLAVVVLVGYAVSGVDPIVYLFFWITVWGGLGILLLMALTSAAVVVYFIRDNHGLSLWRRTIAPGVATVLLVVVLWLTVASFHTLLGVEPTSAWRWIFPIAFVVAALVGGGWALILKAAKPEVYEAIGLGANSVTPEAQRENTPLPEPTHAR